MTSRRRRTRSGSTGFPSRLYSARIPHIGVSPGARTVPRQAGGLGMRLGRSVARSQQHVGGLAQYLSSAAVSALSVGAKQPGLTVPERRGTAEPWLPALATRDPETKGVAGLFCGPCHDRGSQAVGIGQPGASARKTLLEPGEGPLYLRTELGRRQRSEVGVVPGMGPEGHFRLVRRRREFRLGRNPAILRRRGRWPTHLPGPLGDRPVLPAEVAKSMGSDGLIEPLGRVCQAVPPARPPTEE